MDIAKKISTKKTGKLGLFSLKKKKTGLEEFLKMVITRGKKLERKKIPSKKEG